MPPCLCVCPQTESQWSDDEGDSEWETDSEGASGEGAEEGMEGEGGDEGPGSDDEVEMEEALVGWGGRVTGCPGWLCGARPWKGKLHGAGADAWERASSWWDAHAGLLLARGRNPCTCLLPHLPLTSPTPGSHHCAARRGRPPGARLPAPVPAQVHVRPAGMLRHRRAARAGVSPAGVQRVRRHPQRAGLPAGAAGRGGSERGTEVMRGGVGGGSKDAVPWREVDRSGSRWHGDLDEW